MKKIRLVLCVDNNSSFLRTCEDLFSRDGFEAATADSGLKTVEMLGSMKKLPDLVVINVMMPDMNGFELLKVIKNNRRYKRIPILVLGNLDDQDTGRLARDI